MNEKRQPSLLPNHFYELCVIVTMNVHLTGNGISKAVTRIYERIPLQAKVLEEAILEIENVKRRWMEDDGKSLPLNCNNLRFALVVAEPHTVGTR